MKFCPVINRECKGKECVFYVKDTGFHTQSGVDKSGCVYGTVRYIPLEVEE